MYNARIETTNGKTINLGYDYGVVFDITPISGLDIEVSTVQSFQQIGESVENTSVTGLTREIYGVIMRDEKKMCEKILSVFSAFSSGRLYIGDRYCDFTTSKTPYFIREKSGRLTFSAAIYCAYPFWLDSKMSEYIFGGVTPAFSFPVVYDSHIYSTRKPVEALNCHNEGNVRQTMSIEFSTFATVENFGLRNSSTGKFVQIAETITGDDKVNVIQSGGKIRIELTRDNQKSNIINKLVEGSTLFELETGDNVLIPFADEGVSNLNAYIKFNPAYTGVFV